MPVAKESGKDFTPVPAGTHVARCFAVISLGTQSSPMFPASFKVMLMWEVPGEHIEIDGKPAPMTIPKEYTLSLSEKAHLRHDLQSWRGKDFTKQELEGFEVQKVIGFPCMLSVLHKESAKKKTYAVVAAVSAMPKGVQCPPQWHKTIHYEISDGQNDVFQALPEWIQKKIAQCEEWTAPRAAAEEPESAGAAPDAQTEPEDTVPF